MGSLCVMTIDMAVSVNPTVFMAKTFAHVHVMCMCNVMSM